MICWIGYFLWNFRVGGEGATFYFIFYFFVFQKLFFLKIWHSKSGYRQLRRPKSLPRMRFSSLYDASPARNINVCVFLLVLGRKKTSLSGSTKIKSKCFSQKSGGGETRSDKSTDSALSIITIFLLSFVRSPDGNCRSNMQSLQPSLNTCQR